MSEMECPICSARFEVGFDVEDAVVTQEQMVDCRDALARNTETALRMQTKVERLNQGLPQVYRQSPAYAAAIALLCDDYLDRSGALLGEVRDQAHALNTSKDTP